MSEKTPGQIACEAFDDRYQWSEQGDCDQECWEDSAKAIESHLWRAGGEIDNALAKANSEADAIYAVAEKLAESVMDLGSIRGFGNKWDRVQEALSAFSSLKKDPAQTEVGKV